MFSSLSTPVARQCPTQAHHMDPPTKSIFHKACHKILYVTV